jgi:hypothetical protein
MENTKTSEYGKGFVYSLILFAKHFENQKYDKDYSLWFNGASDHLFELKIPKQFKNTQIGKKAKELQELALSLGHGDRMMDKNCENDFFKVIELTKEIGILIDKKLGIKPIRGSWE